MQLIQRVNEDPKSWTYLCTIADPTVLALDFHAASQSYRGVHAVQSLRKAGDTDRWMAVALPRKSKVALAFISPIRCTTVVVTPTYCHAAYSVFHRPILIIFSAAAPASNLLRGSPTRKKYRVEAPPLF